jgi:regulatory protein NPR1
VEKLVSDIESLLYRPADETFSDVIIHVDGKRVAAHRCILAVRCPYFRRFFAAAAENKNKNKEEKREEDATKAVEVKLETLMKNNDKGEKVGYEAFMAVMGYVYGSGGMNPVVCSSSVSCLDPSCPHITCRPAIEFVLEILRASSILEISELKAAAQQHLMNMVHNAQVDDVLLILAVADAHGALHLHSMCLQVIAHSELSILTLEKQLSKSAMEEVVDLRCRLGVPELDMDSPQAKQCKRIYRALDLDDVELVQMLLKEERTTLNCTYGLHYAAMYCDPKIMVDLLKLEIAGDLGDMAGSSI